MKKLTYVLAALAAVAVAAPTIASAEEMGIELALIETTVTGIGAKCIGTATTTVVGCVSKCVATETMIAVTGVIIALKA